MDRDIAKEMSRVKELFDEGRLKAGAEYCQAVMSLGLDPDIMAWVYEPKLDEMHLALVSSLVDRIGPDAIYDLLFKAYDLSATPKEIDPFLVSLYSPNMNLAVDLLHNIRPDQNGYMNFGPGQAPRHLHRMQFQIDLSEPKVVWGIGVYRVRTDTRNAGQDKARWHEFSSRMNKLAA